MKSIEFIEDCLLALAGMHSIEIEIDPVDKTLCHSLGRQVNKGLALTDKQYELAKLKLDLYKSEFLKHNIDVNDYKDKLKQPLREIDRSQYIRIEEYKNEEYICIRFPFNKTKIVTLQKQIKDQISNSEYYHEKGTQKHYFSINEKNIYSCIKAFKNKNFEIDKKLLEVYNCLEEMNTHKEQYIAGIYNLKICNLKEKAVNALVDDIGELPNIKNLALYKDRQLVYGLQHFDEDDLKKSLGQLSILSQKIVNRSEITLHINPEEIKLDKLVYSLWELNRFPLLVCLDSAHALEQLHSIYSSVQHIIPSFQQSVLFRLDNDSNLEFNKYIKNNELNNSIDKNIKIVYINNTKVPKPLLKSDWSAKATLTFGEFRSFNQRAMITYNEYDLLIHYDNVLSPYYKNLYGYDII